MKDLKNNKKELSLFIEKLGFSLFGVADIKNIKNEFQLKKETIFQFNRAVSVGKRLLDSILEDICDKPTRLYFYHYKQINFFLDRGALEISSFIQEKGFKALPIAASQILDWEKQTAHVSHKHIGYLAGLGWIGRNNLLVNPEFGSRFRLMTILTNMPLEYDLPLEKDCGKCRKCMKFCPAEAIGESAADFDHMACYNKLSEFRRQHLVSQNVCGVCVKACRGTIS